MQGMNTELTYLLNIFALKQTNVGGYPSQQQQQQQQQQQRAVLGMTNTNGSVINLTGENSANHDINNTTATTTGNNNPVAMNTSNNNLSPDQRRDSLTGEYTLPQSIHQSIVIPSYQIS